MHPLNMSFPIENGNIPASYVSFPEGTLPETNELPLKMMVFNRNLRDSRGPLFSGAMFLTSRELNRWIGETMISFWSAEVAQVRSPWKLVGYPPVN